MATANKNLSDYDKSLYADAVNFKIGIAVSDWNSNITLNLLRGALDTLLDCGVLKNNILG
jgi:6,7-dimethyl-8-ribityllumazine synthase